MSAAGVTRNRGVALSAIHSAVEAGVSSHDLDGLMTLYAEDASMILLDGSVATGLDAIREQWAGVLSMDATLTLRTRYAIDTGDLALLSNEWALGEGSERLSAVTAEVSRRQPGGGWLYVIDHPFAGAEPEEIAALVAATTPGTA